MRVIERFERRLETRRKARERLSRERWERAEKRKDAVLTVLGVALLGSVGVFVAKWIQSVLPYR